MTELDAVLAPLRRRPDIEAPELRAWDAADRYLLDTAADQFSDRISGSTVSVIGDTHGALTLGLLALGADRVRVHQDSLIAQRALRSNARDARPGSIVPRPLADVAAESHLVLLRLPRALDELDRIVRAVARVAADDAVVLAGNMVKHMTPRQNEILAAGFERIHVSLARGKARLLTASGRRGDVAEAPMARIRIEEFGLEIVAVPGTFAGANLDMGTRALLDVRDALPAFTTALDLACGSGVLATMLARVRPEATVIATDISAVAVESARLTAEANGVDVDCRQHDGAGTVATDSVDLVVLNPPFHVGAAVHTGAAHGLFAEAARVLRPGGELWCVWNSHLAYTPVLQRLVGPTRQISRTRKFTVTASRVRDYMSR